MNPLSIIEPAPRAAASPPLLKEDAVPEGALPFASFVDVADPVPPKSLLPVEGDGAELLDSIDGGDGDAKAVLPDGDVTMPVPNAMILSAQSETSKVTHLAMAEVPRKAMPAHAQAVDNPKQGVDENTVTLQSAILAKGNSEGQLRTNVTGPSAAQTVIEGRIAQTPHIAVAKNAVAQSGQAEIAEDTGKISLVEGQFQLLPAANQQSGSKGVLPVLPAQAPPVSNGRTSQDRSAPELPHLQPATRNHFIAPKQPAITAEDNKVTNDARVTELSVKALDQDGLQSILSQDRPTAAASTSVGAAAAGTETARHAAQQIATVIVQGNGKATEIALNPEELGRVRLTLSAVDGALTLVVLADRPETQELLRRHIDVLAQEFRSLGYESVSFSFDADGQSETADNSDGTHDDANALNTHSAETEEVTASMPSIGLDLRL